MHYILPLTDTEVCLSNPQTMSIGGPGNARLARIRWTMEKGGSVRNPAHKLHDTGQ